MSKRGGGKNEEPISSKKAVEFDVASKIAGDVAHIRRAAESS
ncbi:MAG: hypothetical protein WA964_10885 [Ilumatobacter sp.]